MTGFFHLCLVCSTPAPSRVLPASCSFDMIRVLEDGDGDSLKSFSTLEMTPSGCDGCSDPYLQPDLLNWTISAIFLFSL